MVLNFYMLKFILGATHKKILLIQVINLAPTTAVTAANRRVTTRR